MGRALRRTVGAVLVVVLAGSAVGFYHYSPRLDLTAARGPARSADPAPDEATPDVSPAPTPAPSPTVAGGAGPPDRDAGVDLQVRVGRDGTFWVVETVRLPRPVDRVALAPPDLTLAGPGLKGTRAVATGLTVRADGRSVSLPRRTVRRATTVRLPEGTSRVVLRYRLRGAVKINRPVQVRGRALGALAPLVGGVPADLPVAIAFRSEAVRNLSCVGLPPAAQNCYTGERPDVRVGTDLARRDALVLVQLDLRSAEDRLP